MDDEALDEVADILESVNFPNASREDLRAAIKEALEVIYQEEDEGGGDEDEEDGDDQEEEEDGAEEPDEVTEEEREPGDHGVHV